MEARAWHEGDPPSRGARRQRVVVAGVVVGLLALVGCGGGSGSDSKAIGSTTTSAKATTTRADRTTTSAAPTPTTPAPTTAPTTTVPPTPVAGFGPYEVVVDAHDWTDAGHSTQPTGGTSTPGRHLPVQVYRPVSDGAPVLGAPIFVWSHGLDATVEYFDEFLRAWAARGYLVAAPTFPLTNADAAVTDAKDVAHQPADISFVLNELTAAYGPEGTKVRGAANTERIAAGGHSLGGMTSIAVGASDCCKDARVSAVVSVDGAAPTFEGGQGALSVPVLLIHGEADTTYPLLRSREIFDAATANRYLVAMAGTPHTPFKIQKPAAVIESTVGDFLDAEVKGRPDWRDVLIESGTVSGFSIVEV